MIDARNMGAITGGLTADPEVINGKVIKIRLGVDYAGSERDSDNKSGYFDVTMFVDDRNPNSQFVLKQINDGKLQKGSSIQVAYRLQQERWKAQDGSNRNGVVLIAESINYAGRGSGEKTEGSTATAPAASRPAAPAEF